MTMWLILDITTRQWRWWFNKPPAEVWPAPSSHRSDSKMRLGHNAHCFAVTVYFVQITVQPSNQQYCHQHTYYSSPMRCSLQYCLLSPRFSLICYALPSLAPIYRVLLLKNRTNHTTNVVPPQSSSPICDPSHTNNGQGQHVTTQEQSQLPILWRVYPSLNL